MRFNKIDYCNKQPMPVAGASYYVMYNDRSVDVMEFNSFEHWEECCVIGWCEIPGPEQCTIDYQLPAKYTWISNTVIDQLNNASERAIYQWPIIIIEKGLMVELTATWIPDKLGGWFFGGRSADDVPLVIGVDLSSCRDAELASLLNGCLI